MARRREGKMERVLKDADGESASSGRDEELDDLQNPENWDWDTAERRPGSASARAIVSVAFARQDFDLVSEAAQRSGMKTSEFIRTAALSRAKRRQSTVVYGMSGSLGSVLLTDRPSSATVVSNNGIEIKAPEPAATV